MSRQRFGRLLQKYLQGDCTPEEKAFVEHWYGLLETETGKSGQPLDNADLETRLWNQIQDKMETDSGSQPKVVPLRSVQYRWLGVAASLLLVGWWYVVQRPASTYSPSPTLPAAFNQADWIEKTNESGQTQAIRLDDGSTIRLSAHSTLRYPRQFAADKRTVYLTGDAFFDIARMPARPFYVHAGNVVTKVLGTSFFVRQPESTQQVRVDVMTGRVAVFAAVQASQKTTNGVVLSPNQTVTFFDKEQHFVTGLVESPRLIQPAQATRSTVSFRFDDTPLAEVLTRLEQAYGIDIEVENEGQKNCPLTADLTNQPLYTQLDIICAALQATYEVQGTIILLTGKECSK